MSKLSQNTTEGALRASPPGRRRHRILTIDDRAPEPMSPEHRTAVEAGREQIRRGEIATEEEIDAAFRLFGP